MSRLFYSIGVIFLVNFIIACQLSCSSTPTGINKALDNASAHQKAIRNLSRAYAAEVTILDDTLDIVGAGTIIKCEAQKPIEIIAAAHLVDLENLDTYAAKLINPDQRTVFLKVKKIDINKDLVIFEGKNKESTNCISAPLTKTNPLIGEDLWIIGSPSGVEKNVSRGVVSTIVPFPFGLWIKSDGEAIFGNSGGGAFNRQQELVGVVVAIRIMQMSGGIFPEPGGTLIVHIQTIRHFLAGE